MKKSALINLIVLIAIESVSACTYMLDPLAKEKKSRDGIYVLSLVGLFFGNILLYYLRNKADILVPILIIGIVIVMIPITFFGMLLEHCSFLGETLRLEFYIFVAVTIFHVGLWMTNSALDLPAKKGSDLPSIKS